MTRHHKPSNFIWKIASLLRDSCRHLQYERVMLPMAVLLGIIGQRNGLTRLRLIPNRVGPRLSVVALPG